jgi:DeoR/GlpR family transcriptional regulator of sugar metabolism
MKAEQRQHQILALAREAGQVEVGILARELKVAPETVRRDLAELERRGLVRRTHGGACPGRRRSSDVSVLMPVQAADAAVTFADRAGAEPGTAFG